MANSDLGLFDCLVLTPKAKLLECKTPSVVLPAHDGQIGIWRNHMPILAELGMGIMEVKLVNEETHETSETHLLIDGGFAKVSNNLLTVLAYDVVQSTAMTFEKAQELLDKAHAMPESNAEEVGHKQHELKKATLLVKLAISSH